MLHLKLEDVDPCPCAPSIKHDPILETSSDHLWGGPVVTAGYGAEERRQLGDCWSNTVIMALDKHEVGHQAGHKDKDTGQLWYPHGQ